MLNDESWEIGFVRDFGGQNHLAIIDGMNSVTESG
jgi:hypothetical protein